MLPILLRKLQLMAQVYLSGPGFYFYQMFGYFLTISFAVKCWNLGKWNFGRQKVAFGALPPVGLEKGGMVDWLSK